MNDHTRVEFKTIDGVTFRGDFFKAAGECMPCIMMTQGFVCSKSTTSKTTPASWSRPESPALVYDHRGYHSSDGIPRHETNPLKQAEDYHDAVTAAISLQDVDPARIAIWGIGHSGGATMIAAASDPRVKAVILNMSFQSGAYDANAFPSSLLNKVWSSFRTKSQSFLHEHATVVNGRISCFACLATEQCDCLSASVLPVFQAGSDRRGACVATQQLVTGDRAPRR